MTSPDKRKPIEGKLGQPKFVVAVIRDGVCDVEGFLAALPERAYAQFRVRFERYCTVGFLRSPDHWRKLQVDKKQPDVWEMKVHVGPGYRLFGIVEGNTFVATHGSEKPKKNGLGRHVKRAREDYQQSCAG
jgi:hypothetical protein